MKATTMAIATNMLRTCCLILYLISQVRGAAAETPDLFINSIKVGSALCDSITCKYLLTVNGGEFLGHQPWRLTPEEAAKGASCEIIYPNYELKEIQTSQWSTVIEVSLPILDGKIYFCLRQSAKNQYSSGSWIHQGVQYYLEPKKDASNSQKNELSTTAEPIPSPTQDLQDSLQITQNLANLINKDDTQEAIIDNDNLKNVNGDNRKKPQEANQENKNNENVIEEVKENWADLTHDTDVNYLPNVPRPTREEKNDIEVLVNNTFIPLNDLIEQIKVDSRKSLDFSDNLHQNYIDNDVKFVNNEELIDLNNVNLKNDDNVNLKRIYENFKYVKKIIDKIDTVASKLLTSKRSEEGKSNLMARSTNTPFHESEKEEFNFANNKINTEEMLRKLDDILVKIQDLKCEKTTKYFSDTSSKINIPDLDMPNIFSPEFNSQSTQTLDIDFPEIQTTYMSKSLAPNIRRKRIRDTETVNMALNNMKLPNMFNNDIPKYYISNVLTPNQKYNNLQDIETYITLQNDNDATKISSVLPNVDIFDDDLNTPISGQTKNKNDIQNLRVKLIHDLTSPNIKSSNIAIDDLDMPTNDMTVNDARKSRRKRQLVEDDIFTSVKADKTPINIEGIRIEESDKEPKIIDDGVPSVLAESAVTLRVYGDGITDRTVIAFTHDPQPYGQPCKFLLKGEYMVKEGSLRPKTALFQIKVPAPITGSKLYICAKNLQLNKDPSSDEEKYIHQGDEFFKMFASHNKLLPLWVSIGLILFCLMFSALFSGLNLGLMSLDRTELKIISNTGTEQERKHARAIMPVRDHGNYLLCSILLGNVAVNSTFTILLDELTSGLFAVIFSTLAIVLLGEITPQAICSRHGLMVGARTIFITKGVMAVTAPLSFPVSKLLDYFLGEEIGNVYNRERLKELVKVTTDVNDLDKDEVNIISGALEMRKKTVKDVMTKLEDVFMLPITSVLDFETMSEIVKSGYSRIPVYEGSRGNILTVLFIKDLAFVDPDDNTPLRTLCQYYQNAAHFVFEDVTLDVMFKQFKDGHKGHMAFVHRINNEGEGDPFYETIGLVTLEDVIEEMIQSEIVDETDVFLDNRSKRRRRPQNKLQDFAAFAERHENQRIHISPQLTLATFQFLNTSVDAFRPDLVSETVLRRLLKQDVIQYIKIKEKTKRDPSTYVFQQGKPVDYFVLILEGRVEVTVGRENLVFEAGPFTYFGVQALTQNVGVAESPTPSAMGSLQNINMDAMLRHTFVPDYSVRAITSVYYLTVKRSLYLAAKRATLMEKGNISKGGQTTQEFDTEVDKNLCNSTANISISMFSKKLFGKSTSTLSTKDEALSSTSGVKQSQRVNIIELMQVTQPNYPSSEKVDVSEKYLKRVANTMSITDPAKLLQSVDEDLSLTGEHKTPSRQISPHPMPVSPAPRPADPRNGHAYVHSTISDEQERLLK